jgi:predicted sulfurtransferase
MYLKGSVAMKKIVLLWILILGLMPVIAAADDFGSVTPAELKAMIERKEPGLVIIDTRSAYEYERSHIKTAISIPLSDIEEQKGVPNVPDNALLVFYCSGNT